MRVVQNGIVTYCDEGSKKKCPGCYKYSAEGGNKDDCSFRKTGCGIVEVVVLCVILWGLVFVWGYNLIFN